jgi:hypothetical protein
VPPVKCKGWRSLTRLVTKVTGEIPGLKGQAMHPTFPPDGNPEGQGCAWSSNEENADGTGGSDSSPKGSQYLTGSRCEQSMGETQLFGEQPLIGKPLVAVHGACIRGQSTRLARRTRRGVVEGLSDVARLRTSRYY